MNMLNIPTSERKEILNKLKQEYLIGTEVELVKMDDPFTKLTPGMQGKVRNIDDAGTIFVNWENGSTLGIVYGEDEIKKVM